VLQHVKNDIDHGAYLLSESIIESIGDSIFPASELRSSFPGNDEAWDAIWKQKNPHVKKYLMEQKKVRTPPKKKSFKNKKQGKEEENLDISETLDKLNTHSNNLIRHGKDPLPDILSEAPGKRHSIAVTNESKQHKQKRNSTLVTISEKEAINSGGEAVQWSSEEDESASINLKSPKTLEEYKRLSQQRARHSDGSRLRKKWTEDEVDKLYKGVVKFGFGNWASLISYYDFGDRTAHDLKDKWRNLEKNEQECLARITVEQERLQKIKEDKKRKDSSEVATLRKKAKN